MNHSLLSADANTHLKIVSLALIAAILVVAVGIMGRLRDDSRPEGRFEAGAQVVKAGQPMTYTRIERLLVR